MRPRQRGVGSFGQIRTVRGRFLFLGARSQPLYPLAGKERRTTQMGRTSATSIGIELIATSEFSMKALSTCSTLEPMIVRCHQYRQTTAGDFFEQYLRQAQ